MDRVGRIALGRSGLLRRRRRRGIRREQSRRHYFAVCGETVEAVVCRQIERRRITGSEQRLLRAAAERVRLRRFRCSACCLQVGDINHHGGLECEVRRADKATAPTSLPQKTETVTVF